MKRYLSLIPFAALIALISICVSVFGTDALDGATQVSLLIASAICVLTGYLMGRVEWESLEREMTDIERQREIKQGVYISMLQKREEVAADIRRVFAPARERIQTAAAGHFNLRD